MAKFKYVGDPNDRFSGPDVVEQYGKTWTKGGDAVDLPEKTDEDKQLVRRLRGNTHFLDMSDKDQSSEVAARQKALEQQEKAQAKADAEREKQDEAYREEIEKNRDKEMKKRGGVESLAVVGPRAPGTVTREPVVAAFGGRTVEERTQAEDHTKAGKTKGGGTVEP